MPSSTAWRHPNLSMRVMALSYFLQASDVNLDIDLANVDYISSAGLRVLVAAQKKVTAAAGNMRLLSPNDEVFEVFEMTGLSDIFTVER